MIAFVGNKVDIADSREVETDDAASYAGNNSLLFFEASAKTGVQVNDIFAAVARKLPKTDLPPSQAVGQRGAHTVSLESSSGRGARSEDSRKCCN